MDQTGNRSGDNTSRLSCDDGKQETSKASLFLAIVSPRNIILLTLAFFAFKYAFGEYAEARRFAKTPPVRGKIINSKLVRDLVQTRRGAKAGYSTVKELYIPSVTYEYMVDGKRYTCNKISRNLNEVYISTFPIFANPQVFYDPENPANAYLDPIFNDGTVIMPTLAGMILICWAVIRTTRKTT